MTREEAELLAERVRWHAEHPSSGDVDMFRLLATEVIDDPAQDWGVEVRWQQGQAADAYVHVVRQHDLDSWIGQGVVSVEEMAADIYLFGLVEPHADPTKPRVPFPAPDASGGVFYSEQMSRLEQVRED